MKPLFCLCAFLFMPLAANAQSRAAIAANWQMTPVSALHKLTATAPGVLEAFAATPVQLRAVRGEWECFQVVLTAGSKDVVLSVEPTSLVAASGAFLPRENVRIFRENFVFISEPSGNRVVRKLWWPDALIPLELGAPAVAAGKSLALWVALRVPETAVPGEYRGALRISGNGLSRRLPIALRVENVVMPAPTMRANAALYYDMVRDWYTKSGRAFSDENWEKQKRRYYDFLLDYRLNAYDLPVAWNDDDADEYLRNSGVLSVRLPQLQSPDFAPALERLKKNNALQKAYYYWIDEPDESRYAEVRAATAKLHSMDARLKHCVTIHPNKALRGAVDIWCPNVGDFFGLGNLNFEQLAHERAAGRETWWYTMVQPRAPYPTWLVDDAASSVRFYGWMMARWNISGFVYSMVHGWGPQPLQNIQSFAGTNGDGTLLYPAELAGGTGPMPSIRLMLLREAIEDYELLRSLPVETRAAVLSHVVGRTPHNRIDREADWTRGAYRDLLLDALDGDVVESHSLQPIKLKKWNVLRLASGASPADKTYRVPAIFRRYAGETVVSSPALWLAHDDENLIVTMRAARAQKGEWLAVEIAPRRPSERWRFVVTSSGKGLVEKHTREGHFQVSEFDWKFASKKGVLFEVEMRIPLSVVEGATSFRFNALHRAPDVSGVALLRSAFPDAGDATQMPLATLQK